MLQKLTVHALSGDRPGGPYPNPLTRLSQIGQSQLPSSTRLPAVLLVLVQQQVQLVPQQVQQVLPPADPILHQLEQVQRLVPRLLAAVPQRPEPASTVAAVPTI